jgi:hypothetical protein
MPESCFTIVGAMASEQGGCAMSATIRRAASEALGVGTLIAGLFVAVGVFQASLVAQHQLSFLALQLTWIILVPAGLLLIWLGHHLATLALRASAVASAGALAGLLGGAGCVFANILLQITRRQHPLESYPGLIPAFVAVSVLSVLAAGILLGAACGISGSLLGAARASGRHHTAPVA